jgi:aspartate kinase
MIVMKFGGTSVKDADAIDRACGIVVDRLDANPLVVVSAMSGVTRDLLEAATLAGSGSLEESLSIVDRVRDRHGGLHPSLDSDIESLRDSLKAIRDNGALTPQLQDAVSSCGEVLSSVIFAMRLGDRCDAVHVDARDLIVTDDCFTRANPILDETGRRLEERVRPLLDAGKVVIVGGYISRTQTGEVSTLGRGASDYSASLIGACLGSKEIQIWTDVDGMMTADPRIVRDAWKIKQMSFEEASELAYFGAKVLHPASLLPAVRKGIPVRVLNSLRPDRSGTTITREAPGGTSPIKSFACKRGITAITVTSSRMLMAHGFLRALFTVFDKHRTSVDLVSTSEVSVSLTTDDDQSLDEIVADLQALGEVYVERDMALVCMVGTNLKDTPGIAGQAFGCLSDINIRMISQGASNINLSFVVEGDRADTVMRRLHEKFFQKFEPDIFERVV